MNRRGFLAAVTGALSGLGLARLSRERVQTIEVEEAWDRASDTHLTRYTDDRGRVFQLVTRSREDAFVAPHDIRGRAVYWKERERGVVTALGVPPTVSPIHPDRRVAGVGVSSIAPGHHGFIQVGGPRTPSVIFYKGVPIVEDQYVPLPRGS